jgi:hypothetical protein
MNPKELIETALRVLAAWADGRKPAQKEVALALVIAFVMVMRAELGVLRVSAPFFGKA